MATRWIVSGTLLVSALLLNGCVPLVVVGGAAATASVVHDRRTAGSLVEDSAIELRVLDGLSKEKDLKKQSHINVTSYEAIVLLSGETPTEKFRTRAGEIARAQKEVRRVHNELVIAAPSSMMTRSSDSVITTKVKSALFKVKVTGFDPTRVKVVTENGTVFLMGLLYRKEASEVTDNARKVSGVQRIVTLYRYLD